MKLNFPQNSDAFSEVDTFILSLSSWNNLRPWNSQVQNRKYLSYNRIVISESRTRFVHHLFNKNPDCQKWSKTHGIGHSIKTEYSFAFIILTFSDWHTYIIYMSRCTEIRTFLAIFPTAPKSYATIFLGVQRTLYWSN